MLNFQHFPGEPGICMMTSLSPHFSSPVIQVTKPKAVSKAPDNKGQSAAQISLTLVPVAEQQNQHQAKKRGNSPRAEDSDTDPEVPVAQQMLSFVMDDPDFDSEASDTPKITKVKNRISICTAECRNS